MKFKRQTLITDTYQTVASVTTVVIPNSKEFQSEIIDQTISLAHSSKVKKQPQGDAAIIYLLALISIGMMIYTQFFNPIQTN